MTSPPLLPPGLSPSGPDGLSGPCDMVLLDAQHLRGRLSHFHDGDLALDLQLRGQRLPLCVPLRELQWLRLDLEGPPAMPPVELKGPTLELRGPAARPVRGLCLARRQVTGGQWLLLCNERGQVQRWFVHEDPRVQIQQRG